MIIRLLPPLIVLALSVASTAAVIVDSLSAKNGDNDITYPKRAAQKFQTTSDAWILTEAQIIASGSSQGQVDIAIYAHDGPPNEPGVKIASLFSGSPTAAGFNPNSGSTIPTTFTFPPLALQPNTTYWLVLENDAPTLAPIYWGRTSLGGSYGPGYSASTKISPSSSGSVVDPDLRPVIG